MERQTDTHLNPQEPDALLSRLRASASAAAGPDCPPDSDWLEIASGMSRGAEADVLLHHSASCDHCGPLLRQALEDFSDDVSDEEEAMLASLKSPSMPGLSARMRDQVRARMRDRVKVMPRIPVWAYAACAAACGAVGIFIYTQQPSIDTLLASAYTDQRTFELRMPGAAYAPVRLVRGSSDRSRLDRPSELLDGEARIARELARNPDNPHWLEARGRAELLERDYESAIASFQRAAALQPPGSDALTADLASAYFERAEANNSPADYTLALNSLTRVLNTKPDDAVALFNRALVNERLHLYDRAIEDWQHYLRVERSSDWIPEAKQHLADVEQAKKR